MSKVLSLVAVIFLAGTALMGCNLPRQDTAAIQTAAALTVQAEITSSAPSATATSTTAPFPTLPGVTSTAPAPASPTSTCDVAQFVDDVTIPDDTIVAPNADFTKTWRLKNVGTCSWTPSYAVIFFSGESMSGPATQALSGNVNPGQTLDLSVDLKAPGANGTYTGNWKLRNAAGVAFSQFYVRIKVQPPESEEFAVTGVTYSLSTWGDAGHTNCPRVKANITTNGPGTVTFKWKRQDTPSGGATQSLDFASAGTKTVNYDWARGNTWSGTPTWVGIYVEEPNHQDFGQLDFDTACTSP